MLHLLTTEVVVAEVEFEVVVVPDVVVVRHLRVDPALFTAVPPIEPVTSGRTLHRDNMYMVQINSK